MFDTRSSFRTGIRLDLFEAGQPAASANTKANLNTVEYKLKHALIGGCMHGSLELLPVIRPSHNFHLFSVWTVLTVLYGIFT